MDIDRFIGTNQPAWDRLGYLSTRVQRGVRRMEPDEVDELVDLYQIASGHLAHARATYDDPALDARLTSVVAAANAGLYGTRSSATRAVRQFLTVSFPGAVWRMRWFVLASALLFLIPAFAVGTWIARSDAALEASAPDDVREAYLAEDFEDYYSSQPASQFATSVTVNNIRVSIMAFAVGIAGGIGTVYLMVFNGLNVGFAGGLFHAAGEPGKFWGLILPHGLLELTAVIVAGAAGLRLGWTLIDPGDRRRGVALAEEGRRAIPVVIGLFIAFITAGLIEGFITGSSLPTALRVGIGAGVWLLFVLWVLRYGRSAEATDAAEAAAAI